MKKDIWGHLGTTEADRRSRVSLRMFDRQSGAQLRSSNFSTRRFPKPLVSLLVTDFDALTRGQKSFAYASASVLLFLCSGLRAKFPYSGYWYLGHEVSSSRPKNGRTELLGGKKPAC